MTEKRDDLHDTLQRALEQFRSRRSDEPSRHSFEVNEVLEKLQALLQEEQLTDAVFVLRSVENVTVLYSAGESTRLLGMCEIAKHTVLTGCEE